MRAGCRENTGWTNGPATIARPGVNGTFNQSYDSPTRRAASRERADDGPVHAAADASLARRAPRWRDGADLDIVAGW